MGIDEGELYTATKGREGARGRAVVGYLARRRADYTVKEIADHFRRSAVTIGEGMMKVEGLVRRDKSFEKSVKSVEEKVIRGRKRKYRVSVACPLSFVNYKLQVTAFGLRALKLQLGTRNL
jgi:hypothetical protein